MPILKSFSWLNIKLENFKGELDNRGIREECSRTEVSVFPATQTHF